MSKKGLLFSLLIAAHITASLQAKNFVNNAYTATKEFIQDHHLATPLQQVALIGTMAAYHEGGLEVGKSLVGEHAASFEEWTKPVKKVVFEDSITNTWIDRQSTLFSWLDEKLSGSPEDQNAFNAVYTQVKTKMNDLHLDIPVKHLVIIAALLLYQEQILTALQDTIPNGMWGKKTLVEWSKLVLSKGLILSHLVTLTKEHQKAFFTWIDATLSGEDTEVEVEA